MPQCAEVFSSANWKRENWSLSVKAVLWGTLSSGGSEWSPSDAGKVALVGFFLFP